jgi:hypothetical protein
MSLKDYFEMGREQERQYEKKQKTKTAVKTPKKPSAWSPVGIIIGAGVFYQIAHPYFAPIERVVCSMLGAIGPTITVMKTDVKMLVQKIRGINPEWEKYKQFDELARGKK